MTIVRISKLPKAVNGDNGTDLSEGFFIPDCSIVSIWVLFYLFEI